MGTALPISGFPDFYDPAAGLDLGLAVPLSRHVDLTTTVTYNRFFFDNGAFINRLEQLSGSTLGSLDISLHGGAYSVFSATAGLRYTVATPGRAELYLTGATGLFYETVHDLDTEVRLEDGAPVQASAGAEGDDTSYGFSLGAGVRVPAASGVGVFVEPHYVLVFSETQYVPLRVGLSFSNLLGGGPTGRPLGSGNVEREGNVTTGYELSASYDRVFFSDGDTGGPSLRATLARHVWSNRTGFALGLTYRRTVDTEIQAAFGGWNDRQGVAADVFFFVDALRFTTGAAAHRLRVGFGPTLRHHWGEWPGRSIFDGPEFDVDVDQWLRSHDRLYAKRVADGPRQGTYYLFTDTYSATDWGWVLNLQYDLIFDRITAGPAAGFWSYEEENVIGYGLHVGTRF